MTDVLHVVTLLSDDGSSGGPQVVARSIAAPLGHEIWGGGHGPSSTSPDGHERRFRAYGAEHRLSLLISPGLWLALWRRLGGPSAPSVVHVHSGPEPIGLLAAAIVLLRRKPLIFQSHGMFSHPLASTRARIVRRCIVPLVRRARSVVALTGAERDHLIALGVPAERVQVLSNFVDATSTSAAPPAGEAPVVAFVGRLHPRKHAERFTAAAAELAQRGIDAHFVLAGADQGGLAAAEAADPTRVVRYLGGLPPAEARALIAAATVFVMCSDTEPFGLVAVEAMVAATALLVTDSCDLAGDLGPAGAALVTSTYPHDIADGIARLLADEAMRRRQVEIAAAYVAEHYSPDAVLPLWRALYARSVGSGADPIDKGAA